MKNNLKQEGITLCELLQKFETIMGKQIPEPNIILYTDMEKMFPGQTENIEKYSNNLIYDENNVIVYVDVRSTFFKCSVQTEIMDSTDYILAIMNSEVLDANVLHKYDMIFKESIGHSYEYYSDRLVPVSMVIYKIKRKYRK
jgi:hypothetical protein